jgi:hypothetical protein
LSCLHWELGNYPIFLWTPVDQSRMSSRWLAPRTIAIAMYLHSCVDSGRIFSVFGTKSLTNSFAGAWSKLTRIEIALEPMYTCFFLYCTPQSLTPSTSDAGGKARRATISDLHMTARLCQEFTDGSVSTTQISCCQFIDLRLLVLSPKHQRCDNRSSTVNPQRSTMGLRNDDGRDSKHLCCCSDVLACFCHYQGLHYSEVEEEWIWTRSCARGYQIVRSELSIP